VHWALLDFWQFANYAGVATSRFFYIIIGITPWWLMLKSGVHPTVAGVAYQH